MTYINPKTDLGFKKIFGSAGSEGILCSFLNGVLYDGEPRVVSLQIVSPYSVPRLQGMKDSYLDVRAILDDGQQVIIEMQVLNVPGFEKRVLYNAAKAYSNQLLKGMDYQLLNPVVALTIADFEMFSELPNQVISRFALIEKGKVIAYPQGDVELVFVELTKFTKELSELRGLADEWIYFVKRASELDQVPEQLGDVPEIRAAFEIAEASRLTAEEDVALEQKCRWIADQKMLLEGKLLAEHLAAQAEQQARQAEQQAAQAEQQARQAEQQAAQAEQQARQAEQQAAQAEQQARQAEQQAAQATRDSELLREKAIALLISQGFAEADARRLLDQT